MEKEQQVVRLEEANILLANDELEVYIDSVDEIADPNKDQTIPLGYKRCNKCSTIKKLYLFNRSSGSKLNCTGNCKECQKKTAKLSYDKTKGTRDYKKYYAENKDKKREQSRKYYEKNKERILTRQRKYRSTPEGRAVMNKAHAGRKKSMKQRSGIPYTRELIIERDSTFLGNEFPLCCLCDELITDMNDVHMEHLMSISIGGLDCFTNVGCAHSACNLKKSKDCHEITVEQVEELEARSEEFIEANLDKFPELT